MTTQVAKSFVCLAACGFLWLSAKSQGKPRKIQAASLCIARSGYYFKTHPAGWLSCS